MTGEPGATDVPEGKTRQIKRAADAFEAALRDQARTGSGRAPDPAVRIEPS